MGAFIATFITAPNEHLTWVSKSTYKEYASSERGRRGFCDNCGGGVIWRDAGGDGRTVSLAAACIDEEILLNKELNVLGAGKESIWCKNQISGIDDGVKLTTVKYHEGSGSLPLPSPILADSL